MVTPVFLIHDAPQALTFYIEWLGFRIDWEEQPNRDRTYLQISRYDVVLHLSSSAADSVAGATVRVEVRGLPAYHHQLLTKDEPPMRPTLGPAYWNSRVLEMEVTDPFGNRLIFCEPGRAGAVSSDVRLSLRAFRASSGDEAIRPVLSD